MDMQLRTLGSGILATRPIQCQTDKGSIIRLGTWGDALIITAISFIGWALTGMICGGRERRFGGTENTLVI